ncbi:single-stranded-DNA-specific exonuclease RecJ [Clostridium rectalis]|uniref:single-stranded-DNA-specific exonuclease RecJ n=1 Tax=Clostridium rectalis TaxID=2040295 RepID=UPI0019CF8A31|nr:single-stranded-DNA-specific exonuclease RecJ [Clostridium rectalis]
MKKRWMLKCNSSDIKKLSKETGYDETLVNILVNRGIKKLEDINKFMNASLEDLYDPFLMKDMQKGIDIITYAIKVNKKIVIYGDYDADGVTSTVILYKALRRCNANCSYYVPHRELEGYGMNDERIRIMKEEGVELIITCDNGISSIEPVKLAKKLGIEVIITDHHELPFMENENGEREYFIPEADAIINPKRQDCKYPFKMLCGAGVAFKFVQALYRSKDIPIEETYELLQYVSIGTICDIVDLVDENRILTKQGLKVLKDTKNKGLIALMDENKIDIKKLKSYHIGFVIGPCINATGRLETAELSVKLLLESNEEQAKVLASELHNLNTERQRMTTESVEKTIDFIENSSIKNDKVFVIFMDNIHESIAGIVAGKIREKYNIPTIILTKGKNIIKGSGRSIENYNMFEELIKCKDFLEKFGGHPMAAGLSLKEENIKILREKLNENCILKEKDFIPKLTIDKRLRLDLVSEEFVKNIQLLEPFGKGNSCPMFAEKNVLVNQINILGKDKNTLKLNLNFHKGFNKINGVCFGRAQEFLNDLKEKFNGNYDNVLNNPTNLFMDFIFYADINEYKGFVTPQIRIIDYRFSNNSKKK